MSTNPYQPPTAELEMRPVGVAVPPDIAKKIRNAWIAGAISISITLVFVGMAIGGKSIAGIGAEGFIDVILMAGLSYGVYRNSRTCAILLLLLFVVNKLIMLSHGVGAASSVVTLAFLWFFAQGVVGTFQFHRWKRAQRAGNAAA